jgi:hypothetical protein
MTHITINASRYGGEHTIGTITQEQGHFWFQMGDELFTQYLHFQNVGGNDDLNVKWNIPKSLQLKEFWMIDDIQHFNAPEFADQNQIEFAQVKEDGEEETVATIDFAMIDSNIVINGVSEVENYHGDDVVVYGQSYAKGSFITAFEIEGDFDLSKLKLFCTDWSNLKLVEGFEYDGDLIGFGGWEEDSTSLGQCAWIDEDTLEEDHDEWCDANPELMKLIASIHMKEDDTLVA